MSGRFGSKAFWTTAAAVVEGLVWAAEILEEWRNRRADAK